MTALHTAKPVLSAVEQVTVSGTTDAAEVDTRVDTGAGRTCIDRSLAGEIGMSDPVDEKSFCTSTDDGDSRPIIERNSANSVFESGATTISRSVEKRALNAETA